MLYPLITSKFGDYASFIARNSQYLALEMAGGTGSKIISISRQLLDNVTLLIVRNDVSFYSYLDCRKVNVHKTTAALIVLNGL